MNQTSIATTIKTFNGDSVSPILIYRRLQSKHKFFMESSRQFTGSGQYSYIGVNPVKSFIVQQSGLLEINHLENTTEQLHGNPFQLLQQQVQLESSLTQYEFVGGLVGHATYDSMIHVQHRNRCEIDLPPMQFDLYDTVIIYSHITDEVIVIHHDIVRSYEEANVDRLIAEIFQGSKSTTQPFSLAPFNSTVTDEQFSEIVNEAKEAILHGEAVQLFITKRFSAPFTGDAFTMYRYLRKELPAPCMFYFEYPDYTIMGVAPDSIIKITGKQVYVTPVTGARPRGTTPREDVKMELTLLQNSREVNAHNILVDSTMADLEKVCMYGTVHLVDYMKPLQFKHSIRLTSEIEGVLQASLKPIEALSMLLPPTASSGVPKKNAVEIVQRLELEPRSFSGGTLGFISLNGNISFTHLQQAMVIKNGHAYIQAGANILQDTMEIDAKLEIRKKLKAFLNIDCD